MDPVIDNEWLGYKNIPIHEAQNVGNVARSWQWREYGINPPHAQSNKTVLENMAEDILVRKPLKIRCCDLPGYPRSTFLMVFSPDGTKVASTHGNHNVYVSELASGKHVRILKGHPRTPWCIAFHPSHPQLIGSGCLGGQVRVWDISSGGSEVWSVRNETVIASIAFHPREQLLVIATYNELYFWDWSQPAPFNKVSTNNINEKVRYVAFDALGYKLITGISLSSSTSGGPPTVLQPNGTWGPPNTTNNNSRDDFDDNPSSSNRPQENPGSAQDMIVNSYQNLVQRYDSLVRNYQRLFMVRHRLINNPNPPNMIDRGTDPMETDFTPGPSTWTRMARPSTSTTTLDQGDPTPGPSHRQDVAQDNPDTEGNSSRLLNLDVLSFDSNPNRNEEVQPQEHSNFGSRSSAFQPLTESGRAFRPVDQSERTTRLLPNPFSTSNVLPQANRNSFSENSRTSPRNPNMNTSRTSIFTSSRPEPLNRDFSRRRRNSSPSQHTSNLSRSSSSTNVNNDGASTSTARPLSILSSSILENLPSTSRTNTQRPTMTNSSTQMSPVAAPMNQTINESLNLIRDILRDSGTRLLNLITNMSLSTLASVERNIPRRGAGSRAHSDDGEGTNRSRGIRPRVRLFSSNFRDLFSSSSDSDSDQSLEVNIFRTRNTTFQEGETREGEPSTSTSNNDKVSQPTDRMVFELLEEARTEQEPRETNRINVSVNQANSRFRVRTQNSSATDDPQPSTSASARAQDLTDDRSQNTSEFNPDRPSTSRDNSSPRSGTIPPDEAYRKVRGGVVALQKHTIQLTNMWLRGNPVSMRELRTMWENLRRRILTLHRETGRQDLPSYTRSFLERCMMLIEMSDNITRTNRPTRNNARNEESDRPAEDNQNESADRSNPPEGEINTTTDNANELRPLHRGRSPLTRSTGIRSSASLRRRLQSSYRWRPEDEIRRRSRNPSSNRWAPRYSNRSRRDFARAIEFSATRLEIRMRAMQVLSVMFKTMMMCLKERGLSQLIINMLRTLKKALALTGLMLMTNRNNNRANNNTAPPQRVDSMNVVRIENVEHPGPVNVDEPDETSSPHIPNDLENERLTNIRTGQNLTENVTVPQVPVETEMHCEASTSSATNIQRWSNRLAVQIAAANRNNSITARTRRDLYIETRRQKALHRTNPVAHPLIKKRVLPPVSTYRIPALRSWAAKNKITKTSTINRRPEPNDEPVAGPSTGSPSIENPNPDSPRSEVINEFEHRVNLFRIAHMQAIRLRNAARNRFRRLQTIRLYTPSSVREMFAFQTNNTDSNPPGNRTPHQNGSELGNRRPFATYRPHILTSRSESANRASEEPEQFHTVLNNVAMPLMPMNDLTLSPDSPGNQQQRLPRIHEYLQPIILAQNAMLVDDDAGPEGGGGGGSGNGSGGGGGPGPGAGGPRRMSGMAGLLDAGIISEALPAPSHRVQAWDFTTGDVPDIADSTKNVVVQKCRIHNDASIDISKDGRLLVALLPVPRLRNTNHWLGVYSLEWSRLGQCLHTAVLEQSAVSVALSPTSRHLAVGLGSRRFTTTPHGRSNVFALLFKLDPLENPRRSGLLPIKEMEQNWEHGFTSLNCLRWAPQPGQGLVYANNTGQLIIMS
ncbi:unnamed protein product [Chilo suppressalis]|uniref:Activating molecule in BECN1-regulated autophagy protein 1 n=1 Tax=Chilo suppressalis TaxID=168631 RepID=A0ABN8L988_CHISP|nr:unnamed protein product [Chilo suppressalis]